MMKEKAPKTFFRSRRFKILFSILLLIIVIRLILPYVVLHYANKRLAHLKGYSGHIRDLDIALYRGAYVVKDVYLHKTDTLTQIETEFFDSRVVDISIEWHALFDGKLVGEFNLEAPTLRFTKDRVEPKDVTKDTANFRKMIHDFMPLDINRIEITEGVLKYVDKGSKPPVDMEIDNMHILAENLTNVKDTALLPASVTATANVYGGDLKFNMKLDPLANSPTFDLNTEVNSVVLPKLNNFFKAYTKTDVNKGTFGLYAEVAAKNEKFIGYVKPVIKELDILGPEDKNDPLLQKIWEGFIGGAGVVFKNQRHDQLATKIPLEGTFNKTDTNLWYAILDILRNAFIEALKPSIDKEININSVNSVKPAEEKKGLLKKIFGKKDKEETRKKEESPKKQEPQKKK
ncbi:MAG: DUF748 domain-containing protein [Bacteroidia bacterium]